MQRRYPSASTLPMAQQPVPRGGQSQVKISGVNPNADLIGFKGDITFDDRMATFAEEPIARAGLTNGNWIVKGNVLPGSGPIRILRIAAYSTDFKPLNGSGTLFGLRFKS